MSSDKQKYAGHRNTVLVFQVSTMSRAQAESVIKNIIREISQECASKGQAVSETLVAFMVSFKINLLLFSSVVVESFFNF